jgi:preprotein translocase subunit SecE
VFILASKQVIKNKSVSTGSGSSFFDKLKWFVIILAIMSSVFANIYYAQIFPLPIRAVGFILLVVLLLLVAVTTKSGRLGWSFIKASRQEMRKVAWPTRQETIQTTMLIIVVVLLAALLLWIFDSFFLYLVRSILSI